MASLIFQAARWALVAVFVDAVTAAYDQPYCSNFNTADTPKNRSIYQSNSLCYNFCSGSTDAQTTPYALAVVQYQGCWCTNYAPASTTTGCDMKCPGWEPELCGSNSPVLFGYIQLPGAISGTRGASAPSSTSAVQATVTVTSNAVTTSSTTSSSTSSSTEADPTTTTTTSRRTTSTTSTSTSTSSTWTPTPITSLETVTGQVRTVTVTPTIPPNVPMTTDPLAQTSKNSGSDGGSGGLDTGGAVGLTIGLVALVALVGAAVFFFYRRRCRAQEAVDDLSRRGSSAGFGTTAIPSRTMSENSRYVLGTDGRRVVETWEPGETAEVRRSRLIPVDQRLDPFSPVYQRGDNKSRESVNTIRDDHDYSRRMVTGGTGILRATNPD